MKFYLLKLLTNTQGQDGSKLEAVHDDRESAIVQFHQLAANLHNADDVLYAVVELLNENGVVFLSDIVNHRPVPQPEPEPQTEE